MGQKTPDDDITANGTPKADNPTRPGETMAELRVTDDAPVTEDNGTAKEVTFVNEDLVGPEDEADDEDPDGGAATVGKGAEVSLGEAGAKKKKKRKPKSKRGLNAATGFEEYYVDAPLTPEQHEEEQDLYHESLPFRERIETAIQRYSAKRNMDSARKNVFDKYMSYGGVDTGPKMFSGGLDAKTLSEKNAAEIRTITATQYVGEDKGDGPDSEYVVDFEGVVKAFVSYHLPIHFDLYSEDTIKSKTHIIRNFLNYLLHHDVCPEYKDQIDAARSVLDQADRELWLTIRAGRLLPGAFNTACSELFGGALRGIWVGDQEWYKKISDKIPDIGISPQMARKTFKTGLIARGEDRIFELYKKQDDAKKIKVLREIETGLEVTELLPAEQEVLDLYNSPIGQDLKPLGRLRAKTWYLPGAPVEDLNEEEEAAAVTAPKEIKDYELWVEDHVLAKCFVGMKFITTIKEPSFGVFYFDELRGIYCSFYHELPNDKMIGWRKVEKTWLPMREKEVDREAEDGAEDDNSATNGQLNGVVMGDDADG